MISLAITLLVIIPHITGSIPSEYDVVQIINNSLPSVVLIIFIVLMAMVLLGFITNKEIKLSGAATGLVAIASLILIGVIFARSAGYLQAASIPYWLDDPQLGALIVVILMFALITWFIVWTPDEKDPFRTKIRRYLGSFAEDIFGKNKNN
jgi:magnesium-transporting ATPase (P-type)